MNTIQYPLYISTKYINNHNHTYNNNNYNNNLSLFNRIKYTITTQAGKDNGNILNNKN